MNVVAAQADLRDRCALCPRRGQRQGQAVEMPTSRLVGVLSDQPPRPFVTI